MTILTQETQRLMRELEKSFEEFKRNYASLFDDRKQRKITEKQARQTMEELYAKFSNHTAAIKNQTLSLINQLQDEQDHLKYSQTLGLLKRKKTSGS